MPAHYGKAKKKKDKKKKPYGKKK